MPTVRKLTQEEIEAFNSTSPNIPTTDLYQRLQKAYDFFNERLFDNKLPQCLITVARKKGARGYFWGAIFNHRFQENNTIDEIALNPESFDRDAVDILSTLVHEMCHLWQEHFGSPSSNGYHNKEWAKKMIQVGLIPSHDGTLEGKQVGPKMTHCISDTGKYMQCVNQFLKEYTIDWFSVPTQKISMNKSSKITLSCPQCGVKASVKEGTHIICADCEEEMI